MEDTLIAKKENIEDVLMTKKEYILMGKDCNREGEIVNIEMIKGLDTFDNHYKYLKKLNEVIKGDNPNTRLLIKELIVEDTDIIQYIKIIRV